MKVQPYDVLQVDRDGNGQWEDYCSLKNDLDIQVAKNLVANPRNMSNPKIKYRIVRAASIVLQ